MNNYSVIFSILGYYFKILTHNKRLLEEQVKHIKKFCITTPIENMDISDCTTLEYIESADIFANVRKQFDIYPTETIKSFEGIFHLKFEYKQIEYFCQIDDEWILIKNNDKSYVVLGNGVNKTTKYLFRVIREILVRKQEDNGKIYMHATALVLNNKGIAILGNKGSGKTTFFTKILDKNSAKILSNDRVFFYKKHSDFYMDYFPIPVVYRIGTVANSRMLNQYIIEQNGYRVGEDFLTGKKSFPVPLTDLPKIFDDCELIERFSIDYLIFTRFHLDWDTEMIYNVLKPSEAKKLLDTVCFTPIDYESDRVEWVYFRKTSFENLSKNANRLTADLSTKVKIIWVEFGRNADVNYILKQL